MAEDKALELIDAFAAANRAVAWAEAGGDDADEEDVEAPRHGESQAGRRAHAERTLKMKTITYGDGMAIMIVAAQRLGLNPGHIDTARRQLEGRAVHPIDGAAMATEAVDMNNRMRHDASLIAKANEHAERLKAEYGFTERDPEHLAA